MTRIQYEPFDGEHGSSVVKRSWGAWAALFVGWLATTSAFAQGMSACLPHDVAVARQESQYGEKKFGTGLGQRGRSIVELFVSEERTWTVLVTHTNGMSCVAASGGNWTYQPVPNGEAT